MQDENLLVRCIAFLRFPLIIAVIIRHNNADILMDMAGLDFETTHYGVLWFMNSLFRCFLLNVRVPLFFFISGLLFFRKTNGVFTKDIYLNKLKNRFYTLVIPYFFWNSFIIILYFILQSFPVTESFFSGEHKMIRDYGIKDFLLAFWNRSDGFPINYIFWFVRDLIILAILSPLLYGLIKYLKWYLLLALTIVWYFYPLELTEGFKIESFVFFMAGAWFSINNVNLITAIRRISIPSLVFFLLIATMDMCTQSYHFNYYIHQLGILSGIPVIFNVVRYGLEKGKIKENLFLAGSSFFVFAAHEPFLTFVRKLIYRLINPYTQFELLLLFILIPIIVVLFTLTIYWYLKRRHPGVLRIIAGGR